MILSVIIVNYRVRYFLELCLASVQKALKGLEAEVFVVDNHSEDGSVEYLQPLFPGVQFILNTENKGFARANNQALALAKGRYVLFLNPDTILPEDITSHCLSFLELTPDIGGLGVRMIDGCGLFLRESRRGFPSPWVAFCKLAGLTRLFPRSRFFSTYYLGHLPEDSTHPAPVLSGACFWVSRAVLEKTGGFDEQFFMYAEDIDLSYRLERAGYVNYYLAGTTIIHFKGESTQKDIRYVRQFYKAMSQFRRKHFNRGIPLLFNGLMEIAIWLRVGIGVIGKQAGGRNGGGRSGSPGSVSQVSPQAVLKTWLKGDPAGAQRLGRLMAASTDRKVTVDPQQADEVIFCEGDGFLFRDCIVALEEGKFYESGRRIKFNAAGSGTAVGSSDREGRGEVLIITEARHR